jgi:multidrug efflux system membrane fusion protein
MRKIRWIILIGGAIVIGALWFFFGRQGHSTAEPGGSAPKISAKGGPGSQGGWRNAGQGGPVPVVAGTVAQKDIPIYLDGIGTVQAFNTVTARNRVDGQIVKIGFTEGQDVKTGDVLAVIDPRPFQAALDQALAKKTQDLAQAGNARVTYQRNAELLQKKVLDQQTYDTSKYLVDQMDATVKADDAAIEAAQVQLDYTSVMSPIDGRVGIRQVDIGNFVQATSTTGIVVITQLKPISVLFTLPQQVVNQVNQASGSEPLKVLAVDRDNTKTMEEGELAVVDNQIDSTTGTVKLKATFPNSDLKLWPGQFINARLLVTTRKGALVVPAAVVQRGPQGSFAYIIKQDGTADMRTVKVGPIEDGLAIIEDGLKVGERVVVDGQYKLQAGSKVEVTSESGAPAKAISENGQKPKQDSTKTRQNGQKNGTTNSSGDAAASSAASNP